MPRKLLFQFRYVDRLCSLLDYDPESGLFTWKGGRRGVWAGQLAGDTSHPSRSLIIVDSEHYQASWLVWLYVYGRFPSPEIDHIDCNPSNDRLANLREATNSQNHGRSVPSCWKLGGLKGAYFDKRRGTWFAAICKD